MKLHDRYPVEGTHPLIYIGHRPYKSEACQRKVSKQWYYEYNHDGRKHSGALKTSNKQAAIKATWAVVQRIERGESQQVRRRVDWEEFTGAYIELKRNKNRAPKTIEKYEYVLAQLVAFARERDRLSPGAFTSSDYWAFNGKMMKDGMADKTRADRLTIVKQVFKWGHQKAKLLSVNPVADEELPEAESARQPCFTPEQVRALLSNADPHEGAIYAVMAYTGMRFGEVRDLEWCDLDLGHGLHGWVTIQRGGSNGTTKGKCTRRIPINRELRPVLETLPAREGRLFSARPSPKYPDGDNPLSERRLLISLKRLCKRCGFKDPDQYKLHTFRHAFASMLARNNVAYKHALAFMGHKDSAILDLYFTMFDKDAELAIGTINYPSAAPEQDRKAS